MPKLCPRSKYLARRKRSQSVRVQFYFIATFSLPDVICGITLPALDTGRQSTPSAVITTNALGCCWNDPCETICSAYLAQIHCDPARTPKYYGALRGLAYAADLIQRDSPDVLRNFVHKEATRGITNESESLNGGSDIRLANQCNSRVPYR